MGRERQKKKNRSSLQKVKPKLLHRTKAGKKKVNFLGNEIIAKNWDRKLTMSQNYNRLGLSSRLNAATGGVEGKARKRTDRVGIPEDSLSISMKRKTEAVVVYEARVERDPETGHILRIIRPDEEGEYYTTGYQPLDDPLNDLENEEVQAAARPDTRGVVDELEAQAEEEARQLAQTKRPRQQSQREAEWIKSLVKRHGDNIMAMVRDRKLNPMQQSEGDIRRRVKTWMATRQSEGSV